MAFSAKFLTITFVNKAPSSMAPLSVTMDSGAEWKSDVKKGWTASC